MLCKFEKLDSSMVCKNCGRTIPIKNPDFIPEMYRAKCKQESVRVKSKKPRDKTRTEPNSKPKLGDTVENMLKSVGVTEDRYKEAKSLFGLPPTCGCSKRKEWLNKVSDWWRNLNNS